MAFAIFRMQGILYFANLLIVVAKLPFGLHCNLGELQFNSFIFYFLYNIEILVSLICVYLCEIIF